MDSVLCMEFALLADFLTKIIVLLTISPLTSGAATILNCFCPA